MELSQKWYGFSLAIRSAATHQERWLLGQYKASCGKTPRQHGRSLCTMARAMQIIEDNQLHEAETTWSSSFKSWELFFFLAYRTVSSSARTGTITQPAPGQLSDLQNESVPACHTPRQQPRTNTPVCVALRMGLLSGWTCTSVHKVSPEQLCTGRTGDYGSTLIFAYCTLPHAT